MSYISEVAILFTSRSQDVKLLSAMDYAMIAEWEKQEIPLVVVLESINQTFDNRENTTCIIKIESLEYFKDEVKKKYADWLQNLKAYN